MTWWEALLLGAVQGVFMFVPVSSTSHLVVTQHGLIAAGSDLPDPGSAEMILFDLVVHLGTIVSIAIVFRRSLTRLSLRLAGDSVQVLRGRAPPGLPLRGSALYLLFLAAITVGVTGVVGLTLYDLFSTVFDRPAIIACTLAATGFVLWYSDRHHTPRAGLRQVGPGTAAFVGLAQAASLLPGISRSGWTMAAGLVAGMRRRWVAEYSFFVAIPTIVLASVVQGVSVWRSEEAAAIGLLPLAVGFVVAAAVGTVALQIVVKLLYRAQIHYFAYYLWALSIAVGIFAIAR